MDLQQPIRPYEKQGFKGYKNYTYISNEISRDEHIPYNFKAIPSYAMDFTTAGNSQKDTRYKNNVITDNNEIARIIDASKPAYPVGQYPLIDHNDIKRRILPEERYTSVGYGN